MSDESQQNDPTSSPVSPQEPSEPASENTAHSEPSDALPEAPEASREGFSNESNDIPPSDSTSSEAEKELENKTQNEPLSEQEQAPEPSADVETKADKGTPQIPGNEPLEELKPKVEKEKPELSHIKWKRTRQLLEMARNAIQFRKRKKLDKIMTLFLRHSKVTNDEVEKFLHVSDATATRYLSQLEKENKIKQVGKTGKGVSYVRI